MRVIRNQIHTSFRSASSSSAVKKTIVSAVSVFSLAIAPLPVFAGGKSTDSSGVTHLSGKPVNPDPAQVIDTTNFITKDIIKQYIGWTGGWSQFFKNQSKLINNAVCVKIDSIGMVYAFETYGLASGCDYKTSNYLTPTITTGYEKIIFNIPLGNGGCLWGATQYSIGPNSTNEEIINGVPPSGWGVWSNHIRIC